MSAEALLRRVADALSASGIPFMLTGSVAAAYHGAGRATMDIDLVIDPRPDQIAELVSRVPTPGMHISAEAAHEACALRSMFNIVDTESGWKADLIVRKTRPFSETEFARRIPIEFAGISLHVATLEDVVISKLEWAKSGGSVRQIDDVRTLLRVHADDIDRAYITEWIKALGLAAQWTTAITASNLK